VAGVSGKRSDFIRLSRRNRRILADDHTRRIEILERSNGQTFVDVGETRVTTGAGTEIHVAYTLAEDGGGGVALPGSAYAFHQVPDAQLALLEQSYAQLKESVYGGAGDEGISGNSGDDPCALSMPASPILPSSV
jgi:hypothetical protein